MSCSFNVLNGAVSVDKSVDAMWATGYPAWVPNAAKHYLAHTENGLTIRALARSAQCHASTIMRQVRRIETRRDDPLVDAGLRALALMRARTTSRNRKECKMATSPVEPSAEPVTTSKLQAESARILRRMSENGAVLAIAAGMEMGVVVREAPDGSTTKIAVVEQSVAQALALNEWIGCDNPEARICRYRITAAGRAELRRGIAQAENAALGFAEGQARFMGATPVTAGRGAAISDSPLCALARRKEKDGTPFLPRDLVAAGERLREDFELSQMGPRVTQDWGQFLTAGIDANATQGTGTTDAKTRVGNALADLGPGLGDVALRCCCYLEGLEVTEKKLGWSARSGKIVLRIALQRLKRHYDELGAGANMIG